MFLCKLGYIVIASLAVLLIGLGGLEFSEFVHDPQRVCPRHQLPLSATLRSHSRQLRENPAIRRSEALCLRFSDAGLPSEKVMASGKNGDDGDLLLFRDGPGACDISVGTPWLFISWESSRPVVGVKGSCQVRCWKVIETFLEYALQCAVVLWDEDFTGRFRLSNPVKINHM
ncbi:hypothetical protein Tco_0777521 [Tanacetum coccineum]